MNPLCPASDLYWKASRRMPKRVTSRGAQPDALRSYRPHTVNCLPRGKLSGRIGVLPGQSSALESRTRPFTGPPRPEIRATYQISLSPERAGV